MNDQSSRLEWMQSLGTAELRLFLMELSHAITVASRLLTPIDDVHVALSRARALNEMQHLIIQILIRIERQNEFRPWLKVLAGQQTGNPEAEVQKQLEIAWLVARNSRIPAE